MALVLGVPGPNPAPWAMTGRARVFLRGGNAAVGPVLDNIQAGPSRAASNYLNCCRLSNISFSYTKIKLLNEGAQRRLRQNRPVIAVAGDIRKLLSRRGLGRMTEKYGFQGVLNS